MSQKVKYNQISLQEKLYRECDVMLKHATSKGLTLPVSAIKTFSSLDNRQAPLAKLKVRHRDFLSSQDLKFSNSELDALGNLHQQLSRVVAPATPYTLLFLQTDAENKIGRLQIFGSVPLLRRMFIAAIVCLFILVGFAFYPNSGTVLSNGLLDNTKWDLVVGVVFRLAAAGLGASFYALYKARSYVYNYTFDPSYEATYWTEFILGLMSGLIFASLLDGQSLSVAGQVSSSTSGSIMSKITIALLGGFSSNVVYEFLNKTVQALASIVKPDVTKVIAAEVREIKANVREEYLERKQELAGNLADLQADLFSGKVKPRDIGERLKEMMQDVVQNDGTKSTRPTRPTTTTTTTQTTTDDDSPVVVVPATNEVELDNPVKTPDEVDPMTVEHYHEDDMLSATESEYVEVFDQERTVAE